MDDDDDDDEPEEGGEADEQWLWIEDMELLRECPRPAPPVGWCCPDIDNAEDPDVISDRVLFEEPNWCSSSRPCFWPCCCAVRLGSARGGTCASSPGKPL